MSERFTNPFDLENNMRHIRASSRIELHQSAGEVIDKIAHVVQSCNGCRKVQLEIDDSWVNHSEQTVRIECDCPEENYNDLVSILKRGDINVEHTGN